MKRSKSDLPAFEQKFVGQIMIPIAFVILVVIAMASFGLHSAASTSNDVSLQRQIEATKLALASSADQLAYEQQSMTTWRQLSQKLKAPELDVSWVDEEIGRWFGLMFRHDMTFILDADDRPIYGFVEGKSRASKAFEAIEDDLQPMIRTVRAEARRRGTSGVIARAPEQRRKTALTRQDTIFEGYVTGIGGRPAAASVMLIVPEGATAKADDKLMVSVRFFDSRFLDEVAAWSMIKELRFSTRSTPLAGETAVEFRDEAGKPIGFFFWRPELPGTRIVQLLTPTVTAVILLLIATMLLLARSLWRSGHQLAAAVVDLQASEAQAQHLAFHDVLTGLPNRALLQDRMDLALARARRGQPCVVMVLDLDRFKQVNDTLGHTAGDTLIKEFAARLTGIVRSTDTVARIGGDEFAILLSDTGDRGEVEQLTDRILAAVHQPFDLLGKRTFVGVSIGAAMVPEAGLDRGDLIRKADIALYRAKAEGRNRCCIFTPTMDESVKLRSELEAELRAALSQGGELQVHYQPEVEAGTERIVGLEALVRWHHPKRGVIQPDQFIPIAEETGLIAALGEWVLAEACRVAARWRDRDLFVAVNVSPVQFRSPMLAARFAAIASAAGCDPSQIELEITESLLLDEDDKLREVLHRLRSAGFRIVLDDFGTGYSSLAYLRRFKVDKIKIDRSFTKNIGHDPESAAIVTSVVTLGHAIGLTVTAEGVENRAQMESLSDAGCNELQGYLFSQAIPEDGIKALLDSLMPGGLDALHAQTETVAHPTPIRRSAQMQGSSRSYSSRR